jgi:hypothetical protein
MKLNKVLIYLFVFKVLFVSSANLVLANAPSSLDGYKMSSVFDTIEGEKINAMQYFIGSNFYRLNTDNTNWTQVEYQWIPSGSTGKFQFGSVNAEYGYYEATLNFSNNTFEIYYEDSETSRMYGGNGTFSYSKFSSDELPFNRFFSDDIQNLYNQGYILPFQDYGMTASIYNGSYTISGTSPSLSERWPESGTNTLLSLDRDWTVQGSAFTNSNIPFTSITLEADIEAQFQLEVHLRINSSSIQYLIQYERFDVLNYNTQELSGRENFVEFNPNKERSFRIWNSANEKSFHLEWFNGTTWQNLNSFNWSNGSLSKQASSSNITTQAGGASMYSLNDWESMSNYYFNPQMEFGVPDSLTVNLGDQGFTSFSVTEGAPEPDPEYAPSSLVGKIYKGSMNDTYQFIDESNAIFYHKENNFQSSEVSSITYTWSPNGNSGTLTTSLNETTTLSFTSAVEGSFSWNEQESGETSSGTFTLEEATTGNAPSSLVGDSMIAGTKTYIFKENGVVTIRTTTGSQDTTYGFVKSGNNEIVFNIPAHADGVTSTLHKMTFSSTGEGTLSEGGSGSFQYFIDGSNQPSTKGWMWFDEYPWVYSHIEGGWLYFNPSGSKLMVFSVKDQAWREMTE